MSALVQRQILGIQCPSSHVSPQGPRAHIVTSLFYAVVTVSLFHLWNVTHHSFDDFSNLSNWECFSLLILIPRIALLSLDSDVTYHLSARREKYSEILNSVTVIYFSFVINRLAPKLFFFILAHPVYKMWIKQEPNMLELWNKLRFEEKETESLYRV